MTLKYLSVSQKCWHLQMDAFKGEGLVALELCMKHHLPQIVFCVWQRREGGFWTRDCK